MVDELYQNYLQFCKENKIQIPASKSLLGKTFSRLFPIGHTCRRKLKGHETKSYHKLIYQGVFNRTPNYDLEYPEYCSTHLSNKVFSLLVPFDATINRQVACMNFEVNRETGDLSITMNGIPINASSFGLSHKVIVDQIWLSGVMVICKSVRLCQGVDQKFNIKSKVPVVQIWNSVSGSDKENRSRTHSHHCQVVIPFNSPHKCVTCGSCKQDLRLLCTKIKDKKKKK